jgi:hypothetical protein
MYHALHAPAGVDHRAPRFPGPAIGAAASSKPVARFCSAVARVLPAQVVPQHDRARPERANVA